MTIRADSKANAVGLQRTGPPANRAFTIRSLSTKPAASGFVVNIKGRKSHAIIQQALQVLLNLNHRGACGCEANTGDGAGILIQMPHEFLKLVAREARVTLPAAGEYGVGMVFLPQDAAQRAECEKIFDDIVAEEGQPVLGWRTIPTSNVTLGRHGAASEPFMRQVFIGRNPKLADDLAFERKLYVIRKRAENAIRYAGKVAGRRVLLRLQPVVQDAGLQGHAADRAARASIIPDLSHPAMESALALVHSRFSTNTFPSWDRAHPYRYIAHNGEINTLRGNINWMHARQALFESDLFGDDIKKVLPIDLHRRQRLGDVRQLPRTARPGRPLAAARDDDDDPRAVDQAREHERREEGVLRISLLPDGAVGRPGLHRLHRRPADRRGARPQRPAPLALLRHQGRPGHHGLRSRRAGCARRARAAKGPAAARPHVPGRHRAGPHRRRRGDQAQDRHRAALSRSGWTST